MNLLMAALCLVLVIEGLLLFISPGGWKRLVAEAQKLDDRQLRRIGAVMIVLGLVALQVLR